MLTVARAENAHPLAAVLAPQIAQAAAGYSHVFVPSTTFGKDLAPRVAALLGVAQISDVMSVEGAHTFKRPIYAGNAIITVEADAAHTVVATIRTASWPAAASGGNSAPIETLGIEYRGKSRRAVPALQLPRRSKSRHRDRTAQDLSGSGGQSCNGGAGEGRRGARRT